MGAFLCWLGARLMEVHRVLKLTGSLYLHIDHTAHAYDKALLDAIFGHTNFRNEVVWAYTGPSNTRRWFPRKHDVLLFYAKSDATIFNRDAVRIPYTRITGTGHNSLSRGNRTDEEVKAIEEEYADRGNVPEDWWVDIAGGGHISRNKRTGCPAQKPLALYERVIKASSNPGDIVLDPFCGCATTPIAAERLEHQWVGMDIWDRAYKTVLERLESEGLAIPCRGRVEWGKPTAPAQLWGCPLSQRTAHTDGRRRGSGPISEAETSTSGRTLAEVDAQPDRQSSCSGAGQFGVGS